MKRRKADVVVVGAGTAGMSAFRAAREEGANVILVESGPYGTTCARVGCMPSKLLIAAADAADAVRRADAFGVRTSRVEVDGVAVMNRLRKERDRFVALAVEEVDRIPASRKVHGHARFVSHDTLSIDGHSEIQARAVVLATGSSSIIPDDFKALGDRAVTNDDVFDWKDLPGSVAVFGTGVIGLELGQALQRLGVRVRMFGEGGKIGPLTDPAVIAEACSLFGQAFALDADAQVMEKTRNGDSVDITFKKSNGRKTTESFDFVLVAIGRSQNVRQLGLEMTRARLDDKGIPSYNRRTMQVGKLPLFVAGDNDTDPPVLHEAIDEGRIAGRNAACFPDVKPGLRRAPLAIVFSDPALLMVGERFSDLDEKAIVIGEISFKDQGRSRVMLKNEGLLRVYADRRTGRFLGAEGLCPAAEHVAHLLAWAVQQKLTVATILQMPVYHPVIEEGVRDAFRDAESKVKG
ncbi:dihydrolipoyl dehydrogenase [Pigmentiphaga litoralis]|uniref:dihydrolipoyl dehydrogenase n=1 Tax=Pigmentiphaga litoralis TaxID=516702 RepID=UPI00167921AA|nr:dihydrolipoyl dehydrogenase [Pigmentiphaga litoralis]